MTTAAVISDTHGLLREELLPALRRLGPAAILHAGDVGDVTILAQLAAIAPVTAIRGNIDRFGDAALLSETAAVEIAGHWVYILHDLQALDLHPEVAGFSVVISGHSHRPIIERRANVLYLNPGSVGPRRFSLPVTYAVLSLSEDQAPSAEIVHLLPEFA